MYGASKLRCVKQEDNMVALSKKDGIADALPQITASRMPRSKINANYCLLFNLVDCSASSFRRWIGSLLDIRHKPQYFFEKIEEISTNCKK